MSKQVKKSKPSAPAKKLGAKAMKATKGGLSSNCCTGKHITSGTITT